MSASVAGSSGDLSDRWPGSASEKKGRSVAGVDQEELVDPVTLADPDSLFCDFNGVHIHHKVCDARQYGDQPIQIAGSIQLENEKPKISYPVILLHGFAASLFSWSKVMKPLAQLTNSRVLAFDRPAFGLTSRNRYLGHTSSGKEGTAGLNPYSMDFSVLSTFSFINLLGSDKAILMGHSAGCLVAANAYFEAPDRIAALVLVAPAIFAPLSRDKPTSNETKNRKGKQDEGFGVQVSSKDPIAKISKGILRLITGFARLLSEIALMVRNMVHSLYKKILSAILRSSLAIMLVRVLADKFGIQFIKNSWCDASKVTNHVIQGYTKQPLRAKNWESALLEYTISMLTDSKSSLARRLSEISCPVLIVAGNKDRIVPTWNGKRLAAAIPDSTFEVIDNCGHLPHEEKAEEFLLVVHNFLQRVFHVPR